MHGYAPSLEAVEGAYWFGSVHLSVYPFLLLLVLKLVNHWSRNLKFYNLMYDNIPAAAAVHGPHSLVHLIIRPYLVCSSKFTILMVTNGKQRKFW